jgi:hypothetical protein
VRGSTSGGKSQYGYEQPEHWYALVGEGRGVRLDACGSSMVHTILTVFDGCPLSGGQQINGAWFYEYTCGSDAQGLRVKVPLGETYYVMVEGYMESGAYVLTNTDCASFPPSPPPSPPPSLPPPSPPWSPPPPPAPPGTCMVPSRNVGGMLSCTTGGQVRAADGLRLCCAALRGDA